MVMMYKRRGKKSIFEGSRKISDGGDLKINKKCTKDKTSTSFFFLTTTSAEGQCSEGVLLLQSAVHAAGRVSGASPCHGLHTLLLRHSLLAEINDAGL